VDTGTVVDDRPLFTETAPDEICATGDVSDSDTSKPLFPAGPLNVIVAVAVPPPAMVADANVTETSDGEPPCARSDGACAATVAVTETWSTTASRRLGRIAMRLGRARWTASRLRSGLLKRRHSTLAVLTFGRDARDVGHSVRIPYDLDTTPRILFFIPRRRSLCVATVGAHCPQA
jgi:hypothetical protein